MFGLNFPFTFIVLKLKVWSRVYIKNEGFVWCKNRNVREGICVLFFPPYKSLVLLHEPQDPILQDRQISLVFPHPITIIFICYVYFTLIMKLKLCTADQQSALSSVHFLVYFYGMNLNSHILNSHFFSNFSCIHLP